MKIPTSTDYVNRYITFLLESNIAFEDIENFYVTGNKKSAGAIVKHMETYRELLECMRIDAMYIGKYNAVKKRKLIYSRRTDADKIIFGIRTVEDFSYKHCDAVVIHEDLQNLLDFLDNELVKKGYNMEIKCGFWPTGHLYNPMNLTYKPHANGKGIDIILTGQDVKSTVSIVTDILETYGRNYYIVPYTDSIHLEYSKSKTEVRWLQLSGSRGCCMPITLERQVKS